MTDPKFVFVVCDNDTRDHNRLGMPEACATTTERARELADENLAKTFGTWIDPAWNTDDAPFVEYRNYSARGKTYTRYIVPFALNINNFESFDLVKQELYRGKR